MHSRHLPRGGIGGPFRGSTTHATQGRFSPTIQPWNYSDDGSIEGKRRSKDSINMMSQNHDTDVSTVSSCNRHMPDSPYGAFAPPHHQGAISNRYKGRNSRASNHRDSVPWHKALNSDSTHHPIMARYHSPYSMRSSSGKGRSSNMSDQKPLSDKEIKDLLPQSGQSGKPGSNASVTSEEGHFDWYEGMTLKNGRYVVKGLLGEGTFGRVLECLDLGPTHWKFNDNKAIRRVAIKVVRAISRYISASKIESSILEKIGTKELAYRREYPKSPTNVLRLLDDFMEGENHCLVFNRLGPSLYDFLKQNKYKGYFVSDIQAIAQDCLSALAFLQDHCDEVAHTDLKPENILLVSNQRIEAPIPRQTIQSDGPDDVTTWRPYPKANVQIVDFGSAVFKNDHHGSLINTRQYRSPEVILGLPWTHKSDIWSLGCILVELYTGTLLFNTHHHQEHLAMMQKTTSNIPQWMLEDFYDRRNPRGSKYDQTVASRTLERLKDDELELEDEFITSISANHIYNDNHCSSDNIGGSSSGKHGFESEENNNLYTHWTSTSFGGAGSTRRCKDRGFQYQSTKRQLLYGS